jgi:hypothetical protein
MNLNRGGGLWLALLAAFAFRAPAANERPLPADPFTKVKPVPTLVAFASDHQIPLTGIDLAEAGVAPRKGDEVTLLVTLFKGTAAQQWLACVAADDLTEPESLLKPPRDAVINTSTGRALRYVTTRTALRIRFIGPFSPDSSTARGRNEPVLVKETRTLVSPEYLNAGFDGYCRSALEIAPRIKTAGVTPHYTAGSQPRDPEELTAAKPFNDAVQFTPEEERLDFGVYFSVTTFFSAAIEVAAFRDVLAQVVKMPSVWSVIRHVGVRMDLNYWWMDVREIDGSQAGAARPVYQFPLRVYLNGALGTKTTLAVSSPRPPLQTCAGILAMCIEHPTDESRRLFIRVLAARRTALAGP